MALEPVFVDGLRAGVAVAAVKEDDAVAVGGVFQQFEQVVLDAA